MMGETKIEYFSASVESSQTDAARKSEHSRLSNEIARNKAEMSEGHSMDRAGPRHYQTAKEEN